MPTDLGARVGGLDGEALTRELQRVIDRLEIEIEQLKRRIAALEP